MAAATIYLNLEDDVSKIVARIKRVSADSVVLVCPKRCFLFSDSINLRLLKKQTDLLGKQIAILTMDERGQMYAKEAGFALKYLSQPGKGSRLSDIQSKPESPAAPVAAAAGQPALSAKIKKATQAITRSAPKASPPLAPAVPPRAEPKPMPQVQVQDTVFPPELQEFNRAKRSLPVRKLIFGFVTIALVLVLLLVFVILPKATVVIYPTTEPIARDMDITLSAAVTQANPSSLTLPAVKVDQTLDVTNQFQSQGKQDVGNKAMGMVQIYNFNKVPLNLKASTTLLTIRPNTYLLSQDDMGIRPTTYLNAQTKEVNPNSLSAPVEVVATGGGDDYNVPADTRLEISNQVFGSRPQVLFAKSTTAITGGTSRYIALITEPGYC